MEKQRLGVASGFALFALLAIAVLFASSEPANASYSNQSTIGYVYCVNNIDQWRKDIVSATKGTKQGALDVELVQKTHFVYEAGQGDWEKRVNFQRAMSAAAKDGWQIVDVDADRLTAVIGNSKVSLTDGALTQTKR